MTYHVLHTEQGVKMNKSLIIAFLVVASSSANATVTATTAGAVASANASRRIAQETNNAIYSVNKALENSSKVLVPCYPKYKGGFFDKSIIDRELTIDSCEEEKQKFERLNGVRYKFGKAVAHDNYRNYFYFELLEETRDK